ncbi:Unknown protein [Striga hermonthica]|uniref:Myb/SANT-like domain-containing protein n=1 Tax=Striga hermonthica TaxID=68872 RepID=A0A9N7RLF9_STRHE|nr:Unknown protein [Striga hermonthica]
MSGNCGFGTPSGHNEGDAKWPPENEVVFVNILLDEVLLRNRVTRKFTPRQWSTILRKLTEQCPIFYPYKIKQLLSKCQRLKVYWKRFHTLLTKATGLSWDPDKKVIKGSEEAWGLWTTAHRKDHDLENRQCVHYEALTTIFHGTMATGSNARASTQRVPEERSMGGQATENFTSDLFSEQDDEPMVTPMSRGRHGRQNRCVHQRRGVGSSFDTAMHSWSDLNVSLREKNNKPTTMEQATCTLQGMSDMDKGLF